MGGTSKDPEGAFFAFPEDLRIYHNDNAKKGSGESRHYIRYGVSKGVSGDCTWEYVPNNVEEGNKKDGQKKTTYTLCIRPMDGKTSATLGMWDEGTKASDDFATVKTPWLRPPCKSYYENTTKVEVKAVKGTGPIKAQTCY